MAVYKVPQDVEADDKLIGPFSFRQFIYLIIVAISMAGAWGLAQIFLVLAILPLPIIVFFAALALPLRKDQPMEAYLSAVVSFYFLKSHKRFWTPDGIDSFVTIIPPKNSDRILTKQFDDEEATKRLDYLTTLVETRGWAIRGAEGADSSISNDLYFESQQATDVMDETTAAAAAMTEKLQTAANARKEEAMRNSGIATTPAAAPAEAVAPVAPAPVATTEQPAAAPVQAAPVPPQAAPATTPEQPVATAQALSVEAQTAAAETLADPMAEVAAHIPTVEELRAREEEIARKETESQSRDAITYATGLAEQLAEERAGLIDQKSIEEGPKAPAPAPAPEPEPTLLTKQQAETLSTQKDVTIATMANQAHHIAETNRKLQEGEEVTISLHHH